MKRDRERQKERDEVGERMNKSDMNHERDLYQKKKKREKNRRMFLIKE